MHGTPQTWTLRSTAYKRAEKGFTDWLTTLGYSEGTIAGSPRQVREFLWWMEQKGKTTPGQITQSETDAFMEYFKSRPNRRREGGISPGHVNKLIDTLQKFFKYLKATKAIDTAIKLKRVKEEDPPERMVLKREEIKALYKAATDTPLGMRDRAMLAVYYGCGLRKGEGAALEVSDVLFERRLLYVRKAKNRYERYVPVSRQCLRDLETYIYTARPLLLSSHVKTETLFISERGGAMNPNSLDKRLEVLRKKSGDPLLAEKTFGLHVLRHSIATHLLQAGMELENIALFLGHRSLDSTQIYTHILNEL